MTRTAAPLLLGVLAIIASTEVYSAKLNDDNGNHYGQNKEDNGNHYGQYKEPNGNPSDNSGQNITASVPEPGPLGLLAVGVAALGLTALMRRRWKG
jgi:hypothetical protein